MILRSFAIATITMLIGISSANAFCGFYVAKADTKLFNEASKVVIARDGDRTVITMANDYQGDVKDFAMVIPVPTVLEKEQIHITENKIIDHLDAYTAPRLVEYFDGNPCQMNRYMTKSTASPMMEMSMDSVSGAASPKSLGVTIEAEYTVGEYDIMLLSAKQSGGLETWLKQEGYKIPDGASKVLGSYIKQDMKFFVAKVNLKEQAKLGNQYLRPISVAFESPKFMLPIRLGTVNSKGTQELFIFTLTKKGKVETTNYRTTKIPSNMDIPTYVKEEFSSFYPAMFDTAVKKEGMKTVFLEYAWDMGWCDPCAADPLTPAELSELGVFWNNNNNGGNPEGIVRPMRSIAPMPQAQNVFVTRLHVRYDAKNFPEDLKFQETSDRSNYQGRYVLRHAYTGEASCDAGDKYFSALPARFEKEAQTLSNITGWDISDIRKKMEAKGQSFKATDRPKTKWWNRMWGGK